MQKTCFHLISDNQNEFSNSIKNVNDLVKKWKEDGELNIRVFKITTEEMDTDVIDLQEEEIEIGKLSLME